jgi:hypothetical protein
MHLSFATDFVPLLMMGEMTQEQVNLEEWGNPANWHNGRYSSRRDTRVWVPARPWGSGNQMVTNYPLVSFRGSRFNYGHPRTRLWIGVFISLPVVVIGLRAMLAWLL